MTSIKKSIIKIKNWEYWPLQVFYAPVSLYWLWLSIKARTSFFFSAANPLIPYAGFTLARKTDIYNLIPPEYYPKTILISAGTEYGSVAQALKTNGLEFPVIAKPNIGDRGVQVKLLQTPEDLMRYTSQSKVDFLIQEFIDFEHEAGIFYYRIPGERKGHISGIVSKEYLTVTGDGKSTIEELLAKEDRYLLQLNRLKATYGKALDTVLASDKRYTLPYGSHCRGACFRDISHRIDDTLSDTIDRICQQIPGFHYGRLDIKYKTWENLRKGADFAIIELNGAASEPAHIYDPEHSIFFAWKEVCRHWRLLYQISKANAAHKGLKLMGFRDGLKMLRMHFGNLRLMK